MKAEILIVGDDPVLLETRADLLKGFQVSTATSKHAVDEIRSKSYALIIFCHTVPDRAAQTLINQARGLNPSVKTMAIHVFQQKRDVNAELYEIQLQDPGRLPGVVARLMQPSSFHSASQEVVKQT